MKNNFKNVIAVKLKKFNPEELNKIPQEKSLKELSKDGKERSFLKSLTTFSKFFDNDDKVYHQINNLYFLKIRHEKKDVPSSVLKETVKEKQKEVEQRNGQKLTKKELKVLKDDVLAMLLPKAFIKTTYQEFVIDTKENLLLINTSSLSKADEVISFLKSYCDIEIEVISPTFDIISKLTHWTKENKAEDPFELDDFVSMTDISTGGITEYKKYALSEYADEIKGNIDGGKVVNSLRINWHERIAFTLNDKFIIKQIKTLDSFEENIEETLGESDDEYDQFHTTMTIFVADICEIINDLINLK